MGTRILFYFNVFADLLFSLVDLETWALQRLRQLLSSPGTDIEEAKIALAMTDEQLHQVIYFAGVAHLLGSLKVGASVRYGINAVVNGQATTPSIQWLRYASTLETEHDQIQMPIDMTFDDFFDKVCANPDLSKDVKRGSRVAKAAVQKLFDERMKVIVQGYDEFHDVDILPIEEPRIEWLQKEIPDAPKPAEDDLPPGLADFMKFMRSGH